jgi:hypothetical protein
MNIASAGTKLPGFVKHAQHALARAKFRIAFHVVFTLLALNFALPVVSYVLTPDAAIASFVHLGTLLGGGAYPHTEDSVFWWVLGTANVATLAFCCVLLQVDLRRFFPALWPLVWLKSCASLGFFAAFVLVEHYPSYFAAFVFDGLTVAAMLFFAIGARRALP